MRVRLDGSLESLVQSLLRALDSQTARTEPSENQSTLGFNLSNIVTKSFRKLISIAIIVIGLIEVRLVIVRFVIVRLWFKIVIGIVFTI